MANTQKILVIGASIAGPSLCYWLKHFGFEPTLIERSSSIRSGGFAIDIRGIAIDVAQKMGIYEYVCEQRTTLQSGRYVDTHGNTVFEEEGERFGIRQGDEVEIVRGDLVELLMGTIPDVPCHLGCTVTQLHQSDDAVEVTFNDGRVETFDIVVGADGLHSSTRRSVFKPDEYSLHDLGSYICVFSMPNILNLDHSERMFEKDQKLVHVSSDHDPNVALAGFMFRSNHVLKDIRDVDEQRTFLRDTYTDFGWETNRLLDLMDVSDDVYFDSITQVKMPRWTKGRVALVGDAGYCASPLSGQGTSLALVGAYMLAGELRAADGDPTQAFARYNDLLRPFVDANQRFGQWVSETFLAHDQVDHGVAEQRLEGIMAEMATITRAIPLPEYE